MGGWGKVSESQVSIWRTYSLWKNIPFSFQYIPVSLGTDWELAEDGDTVN
jgi:hypothetical protein